MTEKRASLAVSDLKSLDLCELFGALLGDGCTGKYFIKEKGGDLFTLLEFRETALKISSMSKDSRIFLKIIFLFLQILELQKIILFGFQLGVNLFMNGLLVSVTLQGKNQTLLVCPNKC